MNTDNQQYYVYNPFTDELNKSQAMPLLPLPSMASEFLNLSVKTRPRCSISPINTTTDLLDSTNLSVCQPSLIISDSSSASYSSSASTSSNDSGIHSSILAPLSSNVSSSSLSFNSSSSPYLYPSYPSIPYARLKPTSVQHYTSSTPARPGPVPRKSAVNFHNITDLATSSSSSSSTDSSSNSSDYSVNDESSINTAVSSSSSLTNEQLKKQIRESFGAGLSLLSNNNQENIEPPVENKRKPRTNIDHEKKRMLEWCYSQTKYPSTEQIETICRTLRLDESVVRIWFQNTRARSKQKDRQNRRTN